jgi:hypothetical protein
MYVSRGLLPFTDAFAAFGAESPKALAALKSCDARGKDGALRTL